MQAIEHYNRNFTFGTAVGMTEDECHALHVQKGQLQFGPDGNKFPVILSGWRLTPEELKIIAETGIIWLSICGEGMPPVSLYAENPLFPVGMVYNNGKESWTHGDIEEHDHISVRVLGPCPTCGGKTIASPLDDKAPWRCLDNTCLDQRPAHNPKGLLYPWWWNKGIQVWPEGNAWVALDETFVDLQQSVCGFGTTPAGAAIAYSVEKAKSSK